jgi:hypothetical protein
LLVRGTLHPIVANQLEVVVLLSLYLAVLDDQSNEEQFIDVYPTYENQHLYSKEARHRKEQRVLVHLVVLQNI